MTLSSTTTKTTYSGDGATTAFATGFKFLQNSHVKVILRDENVTPVTETTWSEGTQYTLTGAGEASGGTVTVKMTPTDYTPASGEKLIVKRSAPETQGSALPAGGAFPSATVEQAVDLLTMLVQQHSEEIARALVLSETSQTSGLTMPEPVASQLIAWNSGATDLTNVAAVDASLVTISSAMTPVVEAATLALGRTALGLGTAAVLASGTAAGNVPLNSDGSGLVQLPYDVAFNAGFGSDMTGADLVVQTYGELVMTRAGSFTGEAGYIDTVATGAAAIVDIEKNGTTIYATKPQFAISATALTAGTLKTDGTEDFTSGDRVTFKVTQIGSTIAGQKLRFTLKGSTT